MITSNSVNITHLGSQHGYIFALMWHAIMPNIDVLVDIIFQ